MSHRPAGKIVPLAELLATVAARRADGEQVVLTNGCFDLLHLGHVRCLAAAAELGDVLVVGINSDASVRALKQASRPLMGELERAEIVAALECVDYVTVFEESTALELVRAVRPEVYVKGGDYAGKVLAEADLARQLGGRVKLVPEVPGRSSSGLLRAIRDAAREG